MLKPQLSTGSWPVLSGTHVLPSCIQMAVLLSSVYGERTGTRCARWVRCLADICERWFFIGTPWNTIIFLPLPPEPRNESQKASSSTSHSVLLTWRRSLGEGRRSAPSPRSEQKRPLIAEHWLPMVKPLEIPPTPPVSMFLRTE